MNSKKKYKSDSQLSRKYYLLFILILLCSIIAVSGASILVPEDCKTITSAIIKAKSGDTVFVKEGVYKEDIKLSYGITLISVSLFKAVINGKGSVKAVSLGNNSTISGFEVKNAQIGIYSEGSNNSITKCLINDNKQSGIMCIHNLPLIQDNVIVYNKGSGIQCWNVQSTSGTISHNTIAYNYNHGLSVSEKSSIILENNIIAFNDHFGVKSGSDVTITMTNNDFYLNGDLFLEMPENNFLFDPVFISSKTKNFTLSKESKCRNMASDKEDIGSRILY